MGVLVRVLRGVVMVRVRVLAPKRRDVHVIVVPVVVPVRVVVVDALVPVAMTVPLGEVRGSHTQLAPPTGCGE